MEPLFAKRINSRKTFPRQTIKTIYIWPLIFNSNSWKRRHFWQFSILLMMRKGSLPRWGSFQNSGSLWEANGCLPGELQHKHNKRLLNRIWKKYFSSRQIFLSSTESEKNLFPRVIIVLLNRIWKKMFASRQNYSVLPSTLEIASCDAMSISDGIFLN